MEIRVLKTIQYGENLIYVRRLDVELFEYLFIEKGEIYSHTFEFNARFGKMFLYRIGLMKDVFSNDELMKAVAIVRIGAVEVINMVKEKSNDKTGGAISENSQAVAE